MHHWVFLFFVRFECIVRCFYSLFNLKALLNAFVPCSISVFHLVFLFISLMLLHCCVYVCVFFAQLEWIVKCFCSFFDFNARLHVYIPCLVWVHHQVFMFLVWHECITMCFCSLFDFNALFCVSIPCSNFKAFIVMRN
jgi:hypothetical protein